MKREKKEKSRAALIIDGLIEPEEHERYLLNLRKRVPFNQMPEEKRKEICRKGAEAIHQLHGEKKTAKQSLEKILTLKVDDSILEAADVPAEIAERVRRDNPNATLYDLIQAVAVGRALDGNMKAYELIRDTYGDKPVEKVSLEADVMTAADRALLEKVSSRLADPDIVIAKDATGGT